MALMGMTGIGGNNRLLHMAAESATGGHVPGRRMHALMDSLTHSLELACRGYLCAPLVDCDPETDPECSAAGKKIQFPEPVRRVAPHEATQEISPPGA
jgi:hypothetical protein